MRPQQQCPLRKQLNQWLGDTPKLDTYLDNLIKHDYDTPEMLTMVTQKELHEFGFATPHARKVMLHLGTVAKEGGKGIHELSENSVVTVKESVLAEQAQLNRVLSMNKTRRLAVSMNKLRHAKHFFLTEMDVTSSWSAQIKVIGVKFRALRQWSANTHSMVSSAQKLIEMLQQWLGSTGKLDEYADKLLKYGYDTPEIIGGFTEDDLVKLGFEKGDINPCC